MMDKYQMMWGRLTEELEAMVQQGVSNLHPTVILSYMFYIKESVEHEEK